jgi:hypothetical protein
MDLLFGPLGILEKSILNAIEILTLWLEWIDTKPS